jgi:hypothetical protein
MSAMRDFWNNVVGTPNSDAESAGSATSDSVLLTGVNPDQAGQNTATPLSTSAKRISVEFISGYSESRKWAIWDTKIDPNNWKLLWNDYLGPDESTGPLQVYDDGWGGEVAYQRSDGPQQVGNTVRDGDKLKMS